MSEAPGTVLHAPAAWHDRAWRHAGLAFAILGFGLSVWTYTPGIFTPDSLLQFEQAQSGQFGDWHPPIMAALWFVLHRIYPGPELLFLVHLALFWIGAWAVSDGLTRAGVRFGALFPLLGLAPFLFNYIGLLWKDVALAAAWLFAVGLSFRRRARGGHLSPIEHVLIWSAFVYGALVRANTIFAAAPVALYLGGGDLFSRRLWPQVGAFILAPALLLAGSAAFNTAVHAEKEHALNSLFLFDIVGVSHAEKTNLVPGVWTPEQARLIPTCYGDDKWDYVGMGRCIFLIDTLERQNLMGSPAMTKAWINVILAHPADYLAHRLRYTNDVLRWLGPVPVRDAVMETEITDRRYQNTPNAVFRFYEKLSEALTDSPLFRPYLWLLASIGAFAASWLADPSPQQNFAASLSASAAIYLGTYVFFGVASDFRYAYWSIVASLAALGALGACRWKQRYDVVVAVGLSAAFICVVASISSQGVGPT